MSLGKFLKPINRMEQLLEGYQNRLQFAEVMVTKLARYDHDPDAMAAMSGMIVNWKKLRQAFLTREPLGPDFKIPAGVLGKYLEDTIVYEAIPDAISMWTRSSKRIWALTEKLQQKLELTSLGKLAWKDITPPFPAFAITLPIPIPLTIDGVVRTQVDFIYAHFEHNHVRLMLLCQNLSQRIYLPKRKVDEIQQALDSDDFARLDHIVRGLSVKYFDTPSLEWMHINFVEGQSIMEDMEMKADTMATINCVTTKTEEDLPEHWRLAMRIVACLCIHLRCLARSDGSKPARIKTGSWTKTSRDECEVGMVTDESLVCSVDTTRLLAPEEKAMHALQRQHGIRGAYRLGVHYRSAYMRALPGHKGEEKCVEVDWTIVNNRELKKLALPMGSRVSV